MIKELKQLYSGEMPVKIVITMIKVDTLSAEDKAKYLDAVTLIEEKRYVVIKGRKFANGSKQRRELKEGESVASPMVLLEEIFTILAIDEYEGRDVAMLGVPGDFLHAEMPRFKRFLLKL